MPALSAAIKPTNAPSSKKFFVDFKFISGTRKTGNFLDTTGDFTDLGAREFAGVVQWQNVSFPSLKRGFDSRRPYHLKAVRI